MEMCHYTKINKLYRVYRDSFLSGVGDTVASIIKGAAINFSLHNRDRKNVEN